MYETKISIIVRDGLENWQKLNIVAFLASSVAIEFPESHGRRFVDKSNVEYMAFIKNPMMIYKAGHLDELRKVYAKAKELGISIGIYTMPLFATKNEIQNLEEIKKLSEGGHDYVGLVPYGDRKLVDKAIKGLKLHD